MSRRFAPGVLARRGRLAVAYGFLAHSHEGTLTLFPRVCTATMVATLLGCAPGGPPATAEPVVVVDTVHVVDTVEIQVESSADAGLQQQVALLQLQLLDKDAQLRGTQGQLEGAQQEVVRNMAKLQSQASRAEAASGMAEAEIAMQSLAGLSGGSALTEHAQGARLLAESTAEFNNENYAGALYLATQVRALAQGGQARIGGGERQELRSGESLFAVPVPLETNRNSNVRGGPGLNFGVEFTLEQGAAVVGQSYTSEWVRIVDGQGREGWIFHTLVRSRDRP